MADSKTPLTPYHTLWDYMEFPGKQGNERQKRAWLNEFSKFLTSQTASVNHRSFSDQLSYYL